MQTTDISGMSARVPLLVTAAMRQNLKERGYDDAAIDQMRPDQAWELLLGGLPAARGSGTELEHPMIVEPLLDWQAQFYRDVSLVNFDGLIAMRDLYQKENSRLEHQGVDGVNLRGAMPEILDNDWRIDQLTRILTARYPGTLVNGQVESRAPRFEIHDGGEFFEPLEPVPAIVEGLIYESSTNLFYGAYKSKKTLAIMDLVAGVVHDSVWLRFKVNSCRVLFIDEESGKRRFKLRMSKVCRGHGIERGEAEEKFRWVSLACLKLVENPRDGQALEKVIAAERIGVCVIDSLIDTLSARARSSLSGNAEDSSGAIQIALQTLRGIAERTRVAFILIDHSGKDVERGPRGSSAKGGAVDTLVRVESKRKSDAIQFTVEASRDFEEFEFSALCNFSDGIFNLSLTKTIESEQHLTKTERFVLDLLKNSDHTIEEVKNNATICSPNAARLAVYRLVERGMVERRNPGERVAVFGRLNGAEVSVVSRVSTYSGGDTTDTSPVSKDSQETVRDTRHNAQ